MAPRLKLATQSRSPERQALAEAIARRNESQRQAEAAATAFARAKQEVSNAQARVAEAQRAIDLAKDKAAAALRSKAVLGKAAPPSTSGRELRDRLIDAEAQLETATAVRDRLEQEAKAAADGIPNTYAIDGCIAELLRSDPVVRKLLDRWFALAREQEDLRRALRIIEVKALIGGQPPPFGIWNVTEFNFRGVAFGLPAVWAAAIAELQSDPDALLPS